MANIRTTRVDRNLLSRLTRDPQLIKYLENLGLDIQDVADSSDQGGDETGAAQSDAELARSSALDALNAVRNLADAISTLDVPSAATLVALSAAVIENVARIEDVISGTASAAQIRALIGRLDDIEAFLADRRDAVPQMVEQWIAPTLQNSWGNFGSGYNPVGYFKDPFGIVHMRGLIAGGTASSTVFTFLAGYRPANKEVLSVRTNTGPGYVEVSSTGDVTQLAGGNGFMSFDSLTFRAV